MVKVITYGTYDLLHFGHINLLKNAKALGDYLIVGVTADDFDRARGKINVHQSLMERIENVRATGIADEIIVEEYEGQKIDDIRRYGVDIFTVGSDWVGKFDYLKEYCKVVYLERTKGVSSTELRSKKNSLKMGFVGEESYIAKFVDGAKYVNGIEPIEIFARDGKNFNDELKNMISKKDYDSFLDSVDAVYIATPSKQHFNEISKALLKGKHVLCESPISSSVEECKKLFELANKKGCLLMESIKTAYSLAYSRLILMAKTGKIGNIVSVDSTCTSLKNKDNFSSLKSIDDWAPTALLPVFQLLGNDYISKDIIVGYFDKNTKNDAFTNVRLIYNNAVANVKVGKGIKSEGELIISGTKGYIYVPAPWWKTEYFEIRYENPNDNKRFFFQLDAEGIRYELVSFVKTIETGNNCSCINQKVSQSISAIIESFEKNDVKTIEVDFS